MPLEVSVDIVDKDLVICREQRSWVFFFEEYWSGAWPERFTGVEVFAAAGASDRDDVGPPLFKLLSEQPANNKQ